MSKTRKIRRLNNQLSKMSNKVDSLEWCNSQLSRDLTTKPFKQYTQPPVFASGNYSEEQHYNRIIEYIYKKMGQLYNDAIERDQYVKLDSIKLALYIDARTLHKLERIGNYRAIERVAEGYKFMGHPVIEVIGQEHINFVRTA